LSRPRIVALAYHCDPELGSEHAAGWVWARMLASFADVCLVTRSYPDDPDRTRLRAAIAEAPEAAHIQLEVVSLPAPLRHTSPWTTSLQRLGYLAWQLLAVRVARRQHRHQAFDLAWHLIWSAGWMGSLGWAIGPRFVWGPIGTGVGPPWRLVPSLGFVGVLSELSRAALRRLSPIFNPLVWTATRRASLILVQNRETLGWLPAAHRSRAVTFNNVVLVDAPNGSANGNGDVASTHAARPEREAIFAGRLLPWKGPHLAIRALRYAPDWTLTLYGSGREETRLRELAFDLGYSDRVTFAGEVDRQRLMEIMAEHASVLLFPSLHDEGGWVVQEALSVGLPVVCLDRGGPAQLGGIGVPTGSVEETAKRLASALDEAASKPVDPAVVRRIDRCRAVLVQVLRDSGMI
jgi:glycosyltransferase involved in cell wall biosynthesis